MWCVPTERFAHIYSTACCVYVCVCTCAHFCGHLDVFAQVFCTWHIYICDVQACVHMVCSTVSVVLQAQTRVYVSSCAPLGKTALQRSPLLIGKSPECGWGDTTLLPTLCARPLHSWLNLIPAGVRSYQPTRCFTGPTVDIVHKLFKGWHPSFLKKSGGAGG